MQLENILTTRFHKHKNRQWTAREKLFMIAYLDKVPGATVRGTADLFKVQPKQIREWRNKQGELMMAQPHVKRLNSGAKPSYPDIEVELADWVQSLRNELKPVSRSMVQIKAVALAKSQKYTLQYPNIGQFRWSSKWLAGFLRRYNFSNRRRTTVAQHLPADLEAQRQEFLNFVQYRRFQHNYPLALMGNMDETPLAFDLPNNVTINDTGSKTVSIRTCGYEKSCFTVVLACMADGKKLPPMIIFKLKNIPRLQFPPGVIVRANEKGWMNETEMEYWIEAIWNNRTPCAKNPRSLLVMDSFRGHLVSSVKSNFLKKNTNIAVIPGGLTSKLQPLDVSINKSFKTKVLSLLLYVRPCKFS